MIGWLQDLSQDAESAAWALLNPMFFALRGVVRFRRQGYTEAPGGVAELPGDLGARFDAPRHGQLARRYGLDAAAAAMSARAYATTCQFLEVIDAALASSPRAGALPAAVDVLDVGTKNFEAAAALYHGLAHLDPAQPRRVRVTGVEIDAFRVYRSLYSRADVAEYYRRQLPSADDHRFLPGDVMTHTDRYDVVTWFHPFLDAYPLLAWGLPRRLLRPEAMFGHVMSRLRPGGLAIVLNQNEAERDAQQALIEGAGLEYTTHEVTFELWAIERPRFVHVIHSSADSAG